MYNRFLEAGKEGKNEWWRYVAGIIIVFIGGYALLGQIPLFFLAVWGKNHGYINLADPGIEGKLLNPEVMHVSPVVIQLIEMFIFVCAMLALWVVVRFLHKKSFKSIVTSSRRIRVPRILFSFVTYLAVMTAMLTVQMRADPTNYDFIFKLKPFLISLLIGVTLMPIQTWWEEFFLRGYVLQGLGLIARSALIPVITTSTIFGLLHMGNPEVKTYGWALMLPQYIWPGLMLGLLTALDEGQELAMGAHWANNLFLTTAVTSGSFVIQGSAIYSIKSFDPVTELWTGGVTWTLFLAIMWATYKWNPKKLYKKEI